MAVSLSLLTVAAGVALQGAYFLGKQGAQVLQPPLVIRQFAVGNQGKAAVVMLAAAAPLSEAGARHIVGRYDLSVDPPCFWELRLDGAPWKVACSPDGPHAFVSTQDGRLYAFDLAAATPAFTYLGRHDYGFARVLECNRSGSRLIVAASDVAAGEYVSGELVAWDRASRKRLWRRTDLLVHCAVYAPTGERIYGCLTSGELLEIDSCTGATVRTLGEQPIVAAALSVSPDGTRLACVDGARCVVVDVSTGRTLWSVPCSPPVPPQFLRGGHELLVGNLPNQADLARFELPRGDLLAVWGRTQGVVGLTACDRAAYSWSGETVTAWDPVSGAVRWQLRPGTEL